ncbi:hypothetical protein acdb102_44610 [Acidothermaceae bacterium B102]|nr:hypothetical protein acdb102_44610 [Acidothermaceae bacterium B102]
MTGPPPPPPGYGPPPVDPWQAHPQNAWGAPTPPVYAAPPPYGQYPQAPYQQWPAPQGRPSRKAFWIFFILVQLGMLALTIGVAVQGADSSCDTSISDCNNTQNAWAGILIFWVIIDLCYSTYYGFRHHRR